MVTAADLAVVVAAACVLLVFWGVGARKRLNRLRAQARQAFGALEAVLHEQHQWILDQAERLAADAADDACLRSASQRLQASGEQASVALRRVHRDPLQAAAMASLHQARLALLASMTADLSRAAPWPPAAWLKLVHQELPLMTAFNQSVETYNAAVAQFPALLIAALLRYRKARTFMSLDHVRP